MSNSYRPNRQYISGNPACDGHYHALPLIDVLRIHKRKYREPGKVEYGTAIYRCSVLLGQISVAARSLLSLAAITKHRCSDFNQQRPLLTVGGLPVTRPCKFHKVMINDRVTFSNRVTFSRRVTFSDRSISK